MVAAMRETGERVCAMDKGPCFMPTDAVMKGFGVRVSNTAPESRTLLTVTVMSASSTAASKVPPAPITSPAVIGTSGDMRTGAGRAMASDTMESSKTIGSRARAPTTSARVVVTTVNGQTTSQMVVASSAIPSAVATQVTSHRAQAG